MRYLVAIRALPWILTSLIQRLVRDPWRTLAALSRRDLLPTPQRLRIWLELRSNRAEQISVLPRSPNLSKVSTSINGNPDTVLHFVTNSLPYTNAGYTIRTHQIIEAQLLAGISASAVTRYGYPITAGNVLAGNSTKVRGFNSDQEITYHHLQPTGLVKFENTEPAIVAAEKLVRKLKPAVLHAATDFMNGELAHAVAQRTGLPFVYEVRGFLEDSWLAKQKDHPVHSSRYLDARNRETQVMLKADAITTLSLTMKLEMIERGIDPNKIHLMPNAVPENLLSTEMDSTQARKLLGLPQLPTFGIASTLHEFENTQMLIQVLELLQARGKIAQLLIVGDGPQLEQLKKLAKSSALRERIHIVGRKDFDQVHNYFLSMDVFCLPRSLSRVTSLVTPLKPLEAMALGRVVVGSDLPAIQELIINGETGLLAPPGDASAFTTAVERVLYDQGLRSEISIAAKQWVSQNRTWPRIALQYRDLYARLTQR